MKIKLTDGLGPDKYFIGNKSLPLRWEEKQKVLIRRRTASKRVGEGEKESIIIVIPMSAMMRRFDLIVPFGNLKLALPRSAPSVVRLRLPYLNLLIQTHVRMCGPRCVWKVRKVVRKSKHIYCIYWLKRVFFLSLIWEEYFHTFDPFWRCCSC